MLTLRPADGVLIAVLIFLSVGLLIFGSTAGNTSSVLIEADGKRYEYSVDEERIIKVQGRLGVSVIQISNRKVRFLKSPCPNKICIDEGELGSIPLICMPNGVSVRYKDGESETETDTICR